MKLTKDQGAYAFALFGQRIHRGTDKLRRKVTRTVVDGGCVVLTSELWWKRKAIRDERRNATE